MYNVCLFSGDMDHLVHALGLVEKIGNFLVIPASSRHCYSLFLVKGLRHHSPILKLEIEEICGIYRFEKR